MQGAERKEDRLQCLKKNINVLPFFMGAGHRVIVVVGVMLKGYGVSCQSSEVAFCLVGWEKAEW